MAAKGPKAPPEEAILEAERALFDGRVQGIVVALYDGERPLKGLAGILDWRLRGTLSQNLLQGTISGKAGECAYVPVRRDSRVFHVILAGAGTAAEPGKRGLLPQKTLRALFKNLTGLRLPSIAVSAADFGNADATYFQQHFKGIPLTVFP